MKKHLFLKSLLVLIGVLITSLTTQTWADNYVWGHLYFNNTSTNWEYVSFIVGTDSKSAAFYFGDNPIANTNLYYKQVHYDDGYGNGLAYKDLYFFNGKWNNGYDSYADQKPYDRVSSSTHWQPAKWNYNDDKKWYFDGSTQQENIPTREAWSGVKTRTTSATYSTEESTWPATISLKGTHMDGDASTGRNTISSTAGNSAESDRKYGAVITGLITHTYSSLASGWYFEGWGTGDSPSSTNSSYEYNISSNTTVYGFFSKTYTLSYDVKGEAGSSTLAVDVANFSGTKISGSSIPCGHNITFTASPSTGREVEEWYSDAACTVSLGRGAYDTYSISSLSGNTSVYPKFRYKHYTITYKDQGDAAFSGVHGDGYPTEHVYNTATLLVNPTREGYTFAGWYTNSACTGAAVTSLGATDFTDNITLYAKWTENLSAITINTPETYQGSLSTTGVQNLGVATTLSLSATAANGHKFHEWIKTGNAVLSSTTDNPTTVSADGTYNGSGTVSARFISRFAVIGSASDESYGDANGMPGWDDYSKTIDYVATDDFERTLNLKGNTTYKFRLRDYTLDKNLGSSKVWSIPVDDKSTEYWLNKYDADVEFTLNGSDEITFKITGFGGDHVKIQVLTSNNSLDYYTATFNSESFYGDETHETSTTGGTVTAKDWKDYALTSGQKAKKGKDVTFTAKPETGYTFAGWYKDAACSEAYEAGEGVVIADNVLTLTMNANKTVYAKFAEKMTTINLIAENGSIHQYVSSAWSDAITSIEAGVHTKPKIKAVPATGYYFTGWVRTAGSDYDLGAQAFETEADSIVNNLTGRGAGATSGQTLTAKFEQLEKIYFKNYFSDGSTTTRWEKVYVYFDISWLSGGGKDNWAKTSSNAAYKAKMTKIDDTDVYWAYVPRQFTIDEGSKVGFASQGDHWGANYEFYNADAATRGDYGAHLNMFVPYHVAKYTGKNSVNYFDNGYWRNYGLEAGEEAGYTMRLRTGSDKYRDMGEFLATENPDIIKYRYRLDTITHTQFMVQSAGNLKYKTKSDAVVTISACNDVLMSEHTSSDGNFTLTPNRLGYYVITIDQSGDEMKMSVNYPLAVGDYILEHTYVNESGTTIKTHSDVIKYDSAANVTRYSMFLSKSKEGSTSTLKLRKCTNAATQTWTEGDDTNLSSILTQLASDGNGVYQFDLSVDKTNNRVDAVVTDSTRLYTGKYYIKTDSITGGWINYKRNALEHNTLTFKASNPNSFDYYYCKFFYPIGGSGANPGKIKCVIANDYCNAVSDTLFGDEIATGSDPTVPSYTTYKGTSIRFSYNSTTNQLKRTYLGASANDYYLDLKVSTDNMVYKDNSPSEDINLYTSTFDATWANRCRFEDTEDWVYEKVVKVIPGGKGGIVAKFDATTQELLETDHLLLGCQDGGTCTGKYDIRLVYDFKTNYLMASWIPGGTVSETLENVDMLWERVADNSAQQISFSGSGSLEKVKVVGAIRFDYDSVYYSPSGKPHWTDLSTWSPESRRWLKYFVSFPFDVPVSSVFGLAGAELGRDYIIQKYNGDKRAKEGLYFGDGGNFWENLTKDSIMHANEGYCVIFDNDYARGWYGSWWNHKKSGSHVYLYFPAKDTIASITGEDKEVTVAKHKCNINRYFYELDDEYKLTRKNHIQTDSHWNLIGTPQFHDAYIKSQTTDTAGLELTAYYYLDYSENKWKVQSIAEKPVFKAMHSYWVQWAGTIEWTTDPTKSAFKAPARNQKQARKLSMKLNLMYNGKATDWTYLEMAENADEDFKLCEDLCKVYNQNSTHIYTYAGDYDVAYNKLPIAGRTVNVGVDIYRNGTYTFAMPDNFDGVVILVDNVTETRTNLAAGNYEVYLNKGTYKSRFSLEIGVNSTPTEINDVQDAQGTKARKMMIDGVLYIVKDNVIYDARGNRVQ